MANYFGGRVMPFSVKGKETKTPYHTANGINGRGTNRLLGLNSTPTLTGTKTTGTPIIS